METGRGQDEGGLPAGMEEALRRLDAGRAVGGVEWGAVDAVVMGAARAKLGARRSAWRLVARVGVGVAAAACVAMGVWVGWGRGERLDATRGVTMVDALRLSRLLEGKRGVSKTWDVNGDGVVDERDVEGIARRAVRLGSAAGWRDDGEGGAREGATLSGSDGRGRRERELGWLSGGGARGASLAPGYFISALRAEEADVECVGFVSGAEDEARLRRLRLLRNLGEEQQQGCEPGAALARGLARLPLATIARPWRGEEARRAEVGGGA